MKIYSLKRLAHHSGVTYEYLRHLVRRVKAGEVTEWKGYKFFTIEGVCWLAYKDEPEDLEIDV